MCGAPGLLVDFPEGFAAPSGGTPTVFVLRGSRQEFTVHAAELDADGAEALRQRRTQA